MSKRLTQGIQLSITYSALAAAFFCAVEGFSEGIWILPAAFGILFGACIYGKSYSGKLAVIITNAICYMRYVVIPLSYYMLNDGYDIGDGKIILRHISPILFNNIQVIVIMLLEMAGIYLTIALVGNRLYKNRKTERVDTYILGISGSAMLCVGILLVAVFPQLAGIICRYTGQTYSGSGLFSICYKTALVIGVLALIGFIKGTKERQDEKVHCLITGIVWLVFCVENSLGATRGISRWGLIINLLIGYGMIAALYPQYKARIAQLALMTAGVGLAVLTLQKFAFVSEDGIRESIARVINYKTLNAYFAGPSNIGYAIEMNKIYGGSITQQTLVNDIFGNFPTLNHWIVAGAGSVELFNKTIYGTVPAMDQICPFSGQAYVYMSYVGVALWSGIRICFMMYVDYRAEQEESMVWKYTLEYLMVVLAIGNILNLAIIFQYIWIRILPLMLVAVFNYKIKEFMRKRYVRCELKYENNRGEFLH